MDMRRCVRCGKEYPLTSEFFGIDNSKPEGISRICKPCKQAAFRRYYETNNEKMRARTREWVRSRPNYVREWQAKNKYKVAGYSRQTKEKYPERVKSRKANWRTNNLDRVRKTAREWAARNPDNIQLKRQRRGARLAGLPDELTVDEWQHAKHYWGYKCAYCGLERKLTIDHYIPVGDQRCTGTVVTNVIPACLSCNASKKGKDPIVWLTSKFGEEKAHEIRICIQTYFESMKLYLITK